MAFGGSKQQIQALQQDNEQLRAWITQLRGMDTPQLEAELRKLREYVAEQREEAARIHGEVTELLEAKEAAQKQLLATNSQVALQDVGIYEFAHPLDDAVAYKQRIADLKTQIRDAAKRDAVTVDVEWALNGSVANGRKLGSDLSKLMLRAYNGEADVLVRAVKPGNLESSIEKLSKSRATIGKLGSAMHIAISATYHALRIEEIRLTADYRLKVEEEKERAREERERIREEEKARRDYEREKARLEKERQHFQSVRTRLVERGASPEEIADADAKLLEIEGVMAGVDERAANIRAGYVYVISNIGAFGEDMVKIGMTRRLNPMDRVVELGDASVPFRFDVHALMFAEDAVTLETQLHQRFADRRVNLVNTRREFFYLTPREVEAALADLVPSQVLEFRDVPDADEWRLSDPDRRHHASDTEPENPDEVFA